MRDGTGACFQEIGEQPEEAEQIIMQWAAKHPRKTMLQKFRELFPNAPLGDNRPMTCAKSLGWLNIEYDCGGASCTECWNLPYEEPKGAGEK